MNSNNNSKASEKNTAAKSSQTQAKPSPSNSSFLSKMSKVHKKNLLITLGLCAGIIFIILSFLVPNKSENKNSPGISETDKISIEFSKMTTSEYIKEQENKLCEVLKRVKGISEPYVMITLDSSSEYIYATKNNSKESNSVNNGNTMSSRESQTDVILYSDVLKQESPLLVTEIQPKIKGVAIVCKGINSAEMQLKIINLVSTVLNLPTNRVYVISSD